jgi:hypothetical protein
MSISLEVSSVTVYCVNCEGLDDRSAERVSSLSLDAVCTQY